LIAIENVAIQNHSEIARPVCFSYDYSSHDFKAAEQLAQDMARDRRLELINEAMPD
jgi:hypothetical protein